MTRILQILAALALFGVLGRAVLSLSREPSGLTRASMEQLDRSGVSNPVTAVLLNYRSYDTLLEVAVLLLAVLATWSVAGGTAGSTPHKRPVRPVQTLARLLPPLMILCAGYFLWIGAHAPGGAFQAGAILGGALILLLLAGHRRVALPSTNRGLLALGLVVFLGFAAAPLFDGRNLLQYPEHAAKNQILVIEAAATISIGLTLAALFLGGRGGDPNRAGQSNQ